MIEAMRDENITAVTVAENDEQIRGCCPVMQELRPHLEPGTFVAIVREMEREGYRLAYIAEAGRVVCVAGFRLKRTLFCEKFLYVDDLVTSATARSMGHGRTLLDWLKARARTEGCMQLHLDSGIQRVDAHRFYEREGLQKSGYHFRFDVTS
jgi:GNAT superfamily N-acetyltransferase